MFQSSLLSMTIYFVFIAIIVCSMVLGAYFLGERRDHKRENIPYESGMQPTGPVRGRLSMGERCVNASLRLGGGQKPPPRL